MAMTTTVTGSTSSVVFQRQFLGCGVQGLGNHHVRAVHNRICRSVSAKFQVHDIAKHQLDMGKNVLAGALFAALANVESASAAQQVIELAAANDSRGYALLIPLVPALGWVLFNILQPGLNQLNRMRNAKGVAIGLGLGALASLAVSSNAEAAQEIAQLAEGGDSRGLATFGVLLPAIGWVLYNILQPALNQFNRMKASKGLIGAVGLGAAYSLLAPQADAAQEIASLAEAEGSDNRGLLLLLVILPAIGWVLFNILQPALNQLNRMRSEK